MFISMERNSAPSSLWKKSVRVRSSFELSKELKRSASRKGLLPRPVRLFLVMLLLGAIVTACRSSRRALLRGKADEKPMVFIYATPAYPIPGQPVVAGVVCAVWGDGTIVRSVEETVGSEYVEGTLSRADLRAVKHLLEAIESGQIAGNDAMVTDAAAEQITVRIDNRPITRLRDPSRPVADPFWQLREMLLAASIEGAKKVAPKEYQNYPHSWYE